MKTRVGIPLDVCIRSRSAGLEVPPLNSEVWGLGQALAA